MIKINSAHTKDGSHRDHYRVALLELLTPTGLTMEKYRTVLDQDVAQIQAHLLRLETSRAWYPLKVQDPLSNGGWLISGPRLIEIEEGSEAEGEGSPANDHTMSFSNSGKNSLSRRIFRRLMLSFVGRKDI